MTNPFETPQYSSIGHALAPREGLPVTLAEALADGGPLLASNAILLTFAALLYYVLGIGSVYACCVGLLVAPVMYWGLTRLTLDTLDGRASLRTLFAGFSQLGHAWTQMALLALAWIVLSIPVGVVSAVAAFVAGLVMPSLGAWGPLLVQQPMLAAWTVGLLSRLPLAPFLVVDRNVQALDALTGSWRLTERSWGAFAGLSAIGYLATLPATVVATVGTNALTIGYFGLVKGFTGLDSVELGAGLTPILPGLDDNSQLAAGAGLMAVSLLLTAVGWTVTNLLAVAAYRRVVPPAE